MLLSRKQAAFSGTMRWGGVPLALLALPIIAASWWFAVWHVSRTGFWYDEAIQFWISLGLDGFSAPLTSHGTLRGIAAHNASANLDPGGFSILLGLWLKVSTNEIWLRTLPLLFFAGGMISLGWLGWTSRRSLPFAICSGLVPAAYPLLLDFSAEVRAYSMEFAGIAIGSLLLLRMTVRPGIRPAAVAGALFGAFLTSRYSYGLFVAAAVIALAVVMPKTIATRKALLAFTIPLATIATLIFLFMFLPQYKARISYQGGVMLDYLRTAMAAGKSAGEIVAMSGSNLLRPAGLPLTLMACVGFCALAPRHWRERIGIGSISPATALFGILALAALILSALAWRWHPWDMSRKWSLWLHALSAVAVIRLAASLLELVETPSASGWEKRGWLTASLLIGALALDLRLASYRRPDGATIMPALIYLERSNPPAGSVAVDGSWYPTVRYFYEYGALTGSPLYPATFRLLFWNGPKPLVTAQTRFLITHRSLAGAQTAFPQATIVRDPELPSQLYRVEPSLARSSPAPDERR